MPARTRASAVVTALLLAGCNQPTQTSSARAEVAEQPVDRALRDRCQSAVHHITTLIAGFGGAPPSEQEAAIIKATEQMSVAKCVHEGLSEAQARCVLDTPDALGLDEAPRVPGDPRRAAELADPAASRGV